MAVGRRRPKLAAGALSGRIWRELRKGATDRCRPAARIAGAPASASGRETGQEVGGIGRAAFGFTELGRFIAMSAYRGGMSEAGFTGMLDPAAVPMIFCVLGGSLRCRPLDGARPENRGPSSKASRPGRAGFSAVNRPGVREAASRTGRKNSAGAGVRGVGAHFRRNWPSCCWLAAAGGGAGGGGAEGGGAELAKLAELLWPAGGGGRGGKAAAGRRFQKTTTADGTS